MKLEKLKGVKIKKNEMISIKGGTTATEYKQTGYAEMETEIDPQTGLPLGPAKLVNFPD